MLESIPYIFVLFLVISIISQLSDGDCHVFSPILFFFMTHITPGFVLSGNAKPFDFYLLGLP
jgi:hypothetical protein